MKKLLVIIACGALAGAFTSCDKKCHCKQWVGGVSAAHVFEPQDDMKCSDYNTVAEVNGVKTGIECK